MLLQIFNCLRTSSVKFRSSCNAVAAKPPPIEDSGCTGARAITHRQAGTGNSAWAVVERDCAKKNTGRDPGSEVDKTDTHDLAAGAESTGIRANTYGERHGGLARPPPPEGRGGRFRRPTGPYDAGGNYGIRRHVDPPESRRKAQTHEPDRALRGPVTSSAARRQWRLAQAEK